MLHQLFINYIENLQHRVYFRDLKDPNFIFDTSRISVDPDEGLMRIRVNY